MVDIIDIVDRLPGNLKDRNRKARPLSAITQIVVHYDDVALPPAEAEHIAYDPVARYAAQARYHMERNWNEGPGPIVRGFGLMYHYRVSADGRVWRTQPESLVTWHARGANYAGLAICCDLGSDQQPPRAELEGLHALLDRLCYHRPDIPAGRDDVWGHGELKSAGNRTKCPGALLPWAQAYRSGSW